MALKWTAKDEILNPEYQTQKTTDPKKKGQLRGNATRTESRGGPRRRESGVICRESSKMAGTR